MEPITMALVLTIAMLSTLLVKVSIDNKKLIKHSDVSIRLCGDMLDIHKDLTLHSSTHHT